MNIQLKCRCGALRGLASGISESRGRRIVCMCDDCQAYAHFLERADEVLDENGGTEVCPVVPSKLTITQGNDHLTCVRLSEHGMFRWYAGCCKTPIANSMPSSKAPFAGVVHTIMDMASDQTTRDDVLGPIAARVQGKYGLGKLPPDSHQTAPMHLILRTVQFLFVAWIKQQHQPSPFFDSVSGKPRVDPYILTSDERERLRTFCGPKK